MREAREAADMLRSEEIDKTRAQIQHLQEQAKQEIMREKDSALDSLRQEVADLAINAAEKILNENLDADRQKRIVDDFLKSLPKNWRRCPEHASRSRQPTDDRRKQSWINE